MCLCGLLISTIYVYTCVVFTDVNYSAGTMAYMFLRFHSLHIPQFTTKATVRRGV